MEIMEISTQKFNKNTFVTFNRLGYNVSNNDIMKLCLLHPYDAVYEVVCKESSTDDLDLPKLERHVAFNIMFMASYYGDTDFCQHFLSSQGTALAVNYV